MRGLFGGKTERTLALTLLLWLAVAAPAAAEPAASDAAPAAADAAPQTEQPAATVAAAG